MAKRDDIMTDLECAEQDAEISREFWNAWLESELREQERVDGIVAGAGIVIFLLFAVALFNMFAGA